MFFCRWHRSTVRNLYVSLLVTACTNTVVICRAPGAIMIAIVSLIVIVIETVIRIAATMIGTMIESDVRTPEKEIMSVGKDQVPGTVIDMVAARDLVVTGVPALLVGHPVAHLLVTNLKGNGHDLVMTPVRKQIYIKACLLCEASHQQRNPM